MSTSKPCILLVDNEDDLREIVALGLKAKFQVEILEARTLEEAKKYLLSHTVNLIIAEYSLPTGKVDALLEHPSVKKKLIPFLLFTSFPYSSIPNSLLERIQALISKPCLDGSLNDYVADYLKNPEEEKKGYVKIHKRWILDLPDACADYYLKLSNQHYVLFIKKGTTKTSESFQRLLNKNHDSVWVLMTQAEPVYEALLKKVQQTRSDLLQSWTSEIHWESQVAEAIHSFFSAYGWSSKVQELTQQTLMQVEQKMQELPKLRDFLQDIKKASSHYLYLHATSLAYVLVGFLHELKVLASYNEEDIKSLVASALIHDIALTEEIADSRMKFREVINIERVPSTSQQSESFQAYKEHPELAAHVAMAWKGVSPCVVDIVMHHHERPDGKGFPFGYNYKDLTFLSSLFILAHDLMEYILSENQPDPLEFYKSRQSLYSQGHFKNILDKVRSI